MLAEQIRWDALGCPREIGLYPLAGERVRVKKIHIIVAENDPAARFTVVSIRPPIGPVEYTLGHRIA